MAEAGRWISVRRPRPAGGDVITRHTLAPLSMVVRPSGVCIGPRQMLSPWVTSQPLQGVMSLGSATAIAGISAPQP